MRATCSCGRAEVELGMDLCALCRADYEDRQREEEDAEEALLDRAGREPSRDGIPF